MCGIIGITGTRPCVDGLLDGIARLEYRGYDSAGIMVRSDEGDIEVLKDAGRLWALRETVSANPPEGRVGIGHTRWATHGRPTAENAHPHETGGLVVVHNGIIDNFLELRADLVESGIELKSDTDTEILGYVVDAAIARRDGDIGAGLRDALRRVSGSYALAAWARTDPEAIWFARHESPMVLGITRDGHVLASDPLALVAHTRRVIYLDDGTYGRIDREGIELRSVESGEELAAEVHELSWQTAQVDRGPYKHFMLKEIHEQPEAVERTIAHLLDGGDGAPASGIDALTAADAKRIERVQLLACGTSLQAAEVARYYFARLAGIPAQADQAGEWRSLGSCGGAETLTMAISQSGETADTLQALRMAARTGTHMAGVVNVPGSSIARMVRTVVHTVAGPEISVASTKAFTTQLAALYVFAARLGRLRGHLDKAGYDAAIATLRSVIEPLQTVLLRESHARDMAHQLARYEHALYLGRGILHPIAMEGALKLKEISYLHAEGYSAAEMKHGPIALIDERMATVMLVPRGPDYAKALGNLQEIKARDGFVLGFVSDGDDRLGYHTNDMFHVPDVPELLLPLVMVVPMQMLSYHVADYRGTDVDKPRNLAKSVTVE